MRTSNALAIIGVLIGSASLVVAVWQTGMPLTIKGPDERAELVSKVFKLDTIGAERAYLESITGPAATTTGETYEYNLGGCRVAVSYTGSRVRSLSMTFFPPCNNAWSPIPKTIGDVMREQPKFSLSSDCLGYCGNATGDHYIDISYGGSRADNWQYVTFRAGTDGPETREILDKWMAARGEGVAPLGLCDAELRPYLADIAKLQVVAITIGSRNNDCTD